MLCRNASRVQHVLKYEKWGANKLSNDEIVFTDVGVYV